VVTPNTIAVAWTVNNDTVAWGPGFDFQAEAYDTGLNVVTALVEDSTSWVRDDPAGLVHTARQWIVRVQPPLYYLGDANGDRRITSADIIYLVNHVFKGGVPPSPQEAGDVDCSGAITSSDIVLSVYYVFRSGPEPDC
jgi:hypothetical protein